MRQLAIVAHRGASALAPENTLAAFAAALALGVAAIETDLRLTADGQLVLAHDADLQRLLGQPRAIAETTLAELQQLMIGTDEQGQPQRIATPAELLALVNNSAAILFDLKIGPEFLPLLLPLLQRSAMTEQVILGVRSVETLQAIQAAAPTIRTLAFGRTLADVWAMLAAGATIARLWAPWLDADALTKARQFACPVWIMCGQPALGTVGETTVAELCHYRQLGIDAVLLNDPRLAIAANEATLTAAG